MDCSKMKLDTSPCLAGSLICLLISLPCLAQNSVDRAALGPDSSSPPEATATPEATAAPVEQTHSIERRMVSRLLTDQKEIWTSPFHTSRADARWWLIMGSTTAALIPADHWLATQLPNT